MSTNQSMHGIYKIPSKEWAGFKKQVFAAWNERRDALQEAGNAVYSEFKGKKFNVVGDKHADKVMSLSKVLTRTYSTIGGFYAYDIINACIKPWAKDADNKGRTIIKPTQKSLDTVMAKAKSTTTVLIESSGEFEFHFDNSTRSVTISVAMNNRNVDDFMNMNDKFVSTVFKALKSVAWTRGTGGSLAINSEIHENDEFGESMYDTTYSNHLGPVGIADKEHRQKMLMGRARVYR